MPDQLTYIFNDQLLPYKDQGGQDGLLTVCRRLGISLRHRQAALLREKLYAYHVAHGAGALPADCLAAATAISLADIVLVPKLEPVPEGTCLGGVNLSDFLFRESPALLALIRHNLVRDADASSPAYVGLTGGDVGCLVCAQLAERTAAMGSAAACAHLGTAVWWF